jgi:SNF2 family DNA or RNA helicase
MGLGKTLQALALMLSRAPQGPALVIAPTSVCLNWQSEALRFAPTLKIKLFGGGDRNEALANLQPFDLVIASYGLLQQEAALFAGVQWHTIVLDEAQAIKNGATKRSQAVMALQGDFRMVATGTPLENHLGELWNLFRFINPGLLGNLDQFNLRFAGPIEKAQDKRAEAGARLRLRRLIQPFILRRTKSQVLAELPSRTEIVLQVDLSAQETALYESLRRAALEKLAAVQGPASKKAIQILAEMMKLRRACCNPQLVAPELGLASSKLAAFAELLSGLLENRHKVLVFSQFVDHLTLIRQHLEEHGVAYQYLDGSTPMHERKARVDAFQAGQGEVFLISLKAGGMGINLTAADYVIHMDPWWNPAVEDQASDRAHRMGQLRPVTIYRLVARHTIEESIVDLHQHKRDLADSLLEGSDMAARLSAGEMMSMLQEGLKR